MMMWHPEAAVRKKVESCYIPRNVHKKLKLIAKKGLTGGKRGDNLIATTNTAQQTAKSREVGRDAAEAALRTLTTEE
jgi:hypothetical protein